MDYELGVDLGIGTDSSVVELDEPPFGPTGEQLSVRQRIASIARKLTASDRGKRHRRPTSKGKARYRKLKRKGGSQLKKKRSIYQKKWRRTKGRSAPSTKKKYAEELDTE